MPKYLYQQKKENKTLKIICINKHISSFPFTYPRYNKYKLIYKTDVLICTHFKKKKKLFSLKESIIG